MIKIAICEDEILFGYKLKNIISKYMLKKQIHYEIDLYQSGIDFIRCGAEMAKYHIVFFDINMSKLNGIEAAQKLRIFCKETYIVFVTGYIDYTLEGYKVEAIRYILKYIPNFEEAVYESLDAIYDKMNYKPNIICFEFREGKRRISVDRISYIESNLHRLEFNVLEERYVVYTLYNKLNAIEKEYNNYGFIRIHQSYLVNLKFISNVVNYRAYMVNSTVLPIAKSRYRYVKNKFVMYKGEI